MRYGDHTAHYDNKPYQATLAQSLFGTMDRQDAIDFCVQNEWLNVLDMVLTGDHSDPLSTNATA